MDTRRPNGADDAGDASDDLISELARLVGQDARGQTTSERQRQTPPLDAQERVAPTQSRSTEQHSEPAERVEPRFSNEAGAGDTSSHDRGGLDGLEFDFGFGGNASSGDDGVEQTPSSPAAAPNTGTIDDADPIAALIADADNEARDSEQARWQEDSRETEAGSDFGDAPSDSNHGDEDDRFSAPSPDEMPEVAAVPTAHSAAHHATVTAPGAEVSSDVAARGIRERDPLSEIEALIGEAARVNVEPGPMGSRRVRSVYAPEPAKPEPQVEHSLEPDYSEAALSPAERAIYSAAAATGGRPDVRAPEPVSGRTAPAVSDGVGPYQPETGEDYDESEVPLEDEAFIQPDRRRRRSGVIIPAALGAVILAGLVGGYLAFFGSDGVESGEAPVLVADGEPARVEPEPTNTTGSTADSVVFSDIEGETADPADSTLVSRDETEGASGSAVSSLLNPALEEGDAGLANRRVRTVTVRPDGTIVSGDDAAAAGSSILPVDRPDVPELPGNAVSGDPIGAAIAEAIGGDAVGAADAAADGVVASGEPLDAADVEAVASDLAAGDTGVRLPMPRPSDLPAIATAEADPLAEEGTELESEVTGPVGAWVQLSSQRSEEAARAGIPELERRYGVLFGGTPLDVSSVDLGENGVYYRVRLPQPSMEAANSVCGTIQAAGGDCFVLSN